VKASETRTRGVFRDGREEDRCESSNYGHVVYIECSRLVSSLRPSVPPDPVSSVTQAKLSQSGSLHTSQEVGQRQLSSL
jgi:hypothetical protein